jgi:hypothetical protein
MSTKNDLRELEFEIPLNLTESEFPVALLERAQILHMLRFDSKGYLFVCRMRPQEWKDYEKSSPLKVGASRKISIRVVGEEKSGGVLLQVTGKWFEKGNKLDERQQRAFEFFRSMERASYYALENPTVSRRAISFTVVAEGELIKRMLTGLKQLEIPCSVKRLGRLEGRKQSMLEELTAQQTRVLKLAHTLGYYDIPRRTNTEDLAKILGMNKATVGEHLRRAERHVFDRLIQ